MDFMLTFTIEDLYALREAARARAEQIARRKREIDVLRRAVWRRIDRLREQQATPPTPRPPIAAAANHPARAPLSGGTAQPRAEELAAPAPGARTLAPAG